MELVALLVTSSLPETVPAIGGAKVITTGALCPAASENGRLGLLNEKPLPIAAMPATVTFTFPLLLNATLTVLELPTVTLPKATLASVAINCP